MLNHMPPSLRALQRFAPALRTSVAAALTIAVFMAAAGAAGRKFYDDDPLAAEPETQDASGAQEVEMGLLFPLSFDLFVTARRDPVMVRAGNLNTIDEVPDSSWFTNRIGTRTISIDQIVQGANPGMPPAPEQWTVTREKSSGYAPGFTARDAKGETWFVSFDPPSNPEGASAAIVIATKIFWALGYNQIENFLTNVRADRISIDPKATVRRPSGKRTPMTSDDMSSVFERSARQPDGTYRAAAGRLLGGKILGPFTYKGTRSDDPNDLVPHEDRRELRALRVFGAWTNLTDLKAGNTLDALVTQNGRATVKHYLQDVGSTFGVGANGPHDWNEGWEYVFEAGPTRRRLWSLGFALSPWQTADYEAYDAIGRFEGDKFNPETWKPRVPPETYMRMRDDDAFWAARRVMAFSDDLVRAIIRTGQFSDRQAEEYMAATLIKRRDAIGRTYLPRINPIVDPALDAGGALTFSNAAVQSGFAEPPESYKAVWYTFDNVLSESKRIDETQGPGERLQAPAGLPAGPGTYIRVDLSAASAKRPAWARPIHVYFRRMADGWKLIGLERLPDEAASH